MGGREGEWAGADLTWSKNALAADDAAVFLGDDDGAVAWNGDAVIDKGAVLVARWEVRRRWIAIARMLDVDEHR